MTQSQFDEPRRIQSAGRAHQMIERVGTLIAKDGRIRQLAAAEGIEHDQEDSSHGRGAWPLQGVALLGAGRDRTRNRLAHGLVHLFDPFGAEVAFQEFTF